jgi:drug/metabolite transporter (DMT)-like permease
MTRQRQADLLLIAATVIAACGWIFPVKRLPACLSSACAFFAALLLLPFCRGLRVERQQWPRMIISGLWFALNLCLWIYSVSTTPSLGEGRSL